MKKIMHFIMLSCLKATELIEKKLDYKLSFIQNIQLAMHKSMCKACSSYEKQSHILDDVLSFPEEREVIKVDLDKFKADIIRKISEC